MNPDKINNKAIDAYLSRVLQKLQKLSSTQICEILVELRSHILDRASSPGAEITDATIHEAIYRLGPPDALAEMYLTENLMGMAEQTRSPWVVMRTLFRLAIKSGWALMAFLVSLLGYGVATAFLFCAVGKPFYPDRDGLWWNVEGHTLVGLGFIWPQQSDRELLGWWIIPVGLLVFALAALLTTWFARWNVRLMRRSRNGPFFQQRALMSSRSAL